MADKKTIQIFTDGACSGNPGPGGYAIVWTVNGEKKHAQGHDTNTTNNRMELMAAKEALKLAIDLVEAKEADYVEICTDSSYVYNSIDQDWLSVWIDNGWRNKSNATIKNDDLWRTIVKLLDHPLAKYVTFEKVRGHRDNDGNNDADRLAVEARDIAVAKRIKSDPDYTPPKSYRRGVGYKDSFVYFKRNH